MAEDEDLLSALGLRPGDLVAGKYRIDRLLAAGGMGAVVRARHEVLEQDVAIKLMRPEVAQHREVAQRFLREARAAAKVSSDFVARVTDVATLDDKTPFMVMEFLDGEELASLIEREGPLPITDAVDYAIEALAGVDAAHKLGIVHRDLKPANLFLVRNGDVRRVKVLDFGISKAMEEKASEGLKAGATTNYGTILGTPRYMSPEQVSSAKDVDARTDVWSVGLILYEALTRHYPFDGDSPQATFALILTSPIVALRDRRPEIPLELEKVVLQSLERDRNRRFETARDFMRALAPFASPRVRLAVFPSGVEDAAPTRRISAPLAEDDRYQRGTSATVASGVQRGPEARSAGDSTNATNATMAVESGNRRTGLPRWVVPVVGLVLLGGGLLVWRAVGASPPAPTPASAEAPPVPTHETAPSAVETASSPTVAPDPAPPVESAASAPEASPASTTKASSPSPVAPKHQPAHVPGPRPKAKPGNDILDSRN